LLLDTGSEAHLAGLRAVAAERKMTLDEKGLRRGTKIIAAATEEEIYKALGMQFIAPELREGRGEIARALAGKLPELVTDDDISGILHAHTGRSDGVDSLETMANATIRRGYGYFGVADHSKSAHCAGGLSSLTGKYAGVSNSPGRKCQKILCEFPSHNGLSRVLFPSASHKS
jgi:DNA polymerase (family 10)